MLKRYLITVQHKDEDFLDNMYETPHYTKTFDAKNQLYIFRIKRTTTGKISVQSESKRKYGDSLVCIEPVETYSEL